MIDLVNTHIYSIIIFILIISSNYLNELYPCKFRDIFDNSMLIKHIFGVFTIMFFVLLSVPTVEHGIKKITVKSVILYIIFLLMTKTNKHIFLFVLFLLFMTYIIVLSTPKQNRLKEVQEKEVQEKEVQEKEVQEKIIKYNKIISYLYSLILISIFIGVIIYIGEKKIEYKKNFKYTTFFLGKTMCKGSSPTDISFLKALKHAFL